MTAKSCIECFEAKPCSCDSHESLAEGAMKMANDHTHCWYAGDSSSDTIWWYCKVVGCTDQMTTDPKMTPDRLREAAATMEAFWQSTGREYDPDVFREEADQIESEPPFHLT